nr:hypothetical protein CUSKHUHK_CUSKHUHK_CDS_0003 [Microvirus sp.]
MKKFLKSLKIALQVLKCLRCVHLSECPYSLVSTVFTVDKKQYIMTLKEIQEDGKSEE